MVLSSEHRVNSPTDSLAQEAIHKFLKINRYLRIYSRQMDKQGVRPRQLAVLRFLLEAGEVTVGQVQAYLYCSPSTTSAIIAKLEESGYVTRSRSAEDNRVVVVNLTAEGRAIAEDMPLGGIPLLRSKIGDLSATRLETINSALSDLMELMEIQEDE
ncbi:MarR family winged helix-turn-helix transcriptional regulator [Chloroflexi bacterium TSY]|nr:MarR family winged helix-turn-helix transcriptional regulator [Chloroflexi bacterium TSY]